MLEEEKLGRSGAAFSADSVKSVSWVHTKASAAAVGGNLDAGAFYPLRPKLGGCGISACNDYCIQTDRRLFITSLWVRKPTFPFS